MCGVYSWPHMADEIPFTSDFEIASSIDHKVGKAGVNKLGYTGGRFAPCGTPHKVSLYFDPYMDTLCTVNKGKNGHPCSGGPRDTYKGWKRKMKCLVLIELPSQLTVQREL